MYLEIICLLILILPLPIMSKQLAIGRAPFRVVTMGTLAGAIGALGVFAVASLTGNNMVNYTEDLIKQTVEAITNSPQALEALNLADVSKQQAAEGLTNVYSTMASLLPSVFLMMAAVISYIEYNILVRIKFRKAESLKPFAYVRDFALKPMDVIGWFLIYVAAYLMQALNVGFAESIVLNINALVQAVISLQAVSLIFVLCYLKRLPRIVAFLASCILWIIPMGRSLLFILGVIDLLMNLRGRIAGKAEKK